MPFFEKYKVNNEPWPWQENRAGWLKHLRKTLFIIAINYGLGMPFLMIVSMLSKNYEVPFPFEMDKIPSVMEIS
jgi:hypothetical protein